MSSLQSNVELKKKERCSVVQKGKILSFSLCNHLYSILTYYYFGRRGITTLCQVRTASIAPQGSHLKLARTPGAGNT